MRDRESVAKTLAEVRAAHRGDLHIGPAGTDPDLVVEVGEPMDWSIFDGMTTPAGGLWPRWFTYTGNDTSVFAWARERDVERLDFRPVAPDLVLDVSASRISDLVIGHGDIPVTVGNVTGEHVRSLTFTGDPSLLTVLPAQPQAPPPPVTLHLPAEPTADGTPAPADGSRGCRALRPIPGLAAIDALAIVAAPLDVPVDLRSLTHFPGLRKLSLWGAVAYPEALAEIALTSLSLRMVPDLSGLPPLTAWPDLASLLAWNVDAKTGKRLRSELKKRGLTTRWQTDDHGAVSASATWSVSRLRTAAWFVTESGLPFAAWSRKRAKPAVAAFKAASKQLDATTAKDAVEGFTRALNEIGDLVTPDREDAATAVRQLARLAVPPIPEVEALAWFDSVRDF